MKLTGLLLVLLFVVSVSIPQNTFCQSNDGKLSLNEGTIENQFNYVIRKSNDYEDFKMVKSWWLYRLKSHVADSLKEEAAKLNESRELVAQRDQEIETLKTTLQETNEKLSSAIQEKNDLVFLGTHLNKTTYNTIVWFLISGLAFLSGILFVMFKRSNRITVETRNSLSELKEEYEDYRKRTLEREQKTVRKLYDEILKYKNKVTKV